MIRYLTFWRFGATGGASAVISGISKYHSQTAGISEDITIYPHISYEETIIL